MTESRFYQNSSLIVLIEGQYWQNVRKDILGTITLKEYQKVWFNWWMTINYWSDNVAKSIRSSKSHIVTTEMPLAVILD